MEDINDADYVFTKSVFKDLEIKALAENLDLLTDIDMLLMVEKGIRGGTCHAIHRKEDTEIFDFIQNPKSGKTHILIFADCYPLMEKIDAKNSENPESS